jgi:hypothetical protein
MDYYLENFDCDAVDYHLALLIDAGLTKGTVSHGPGEVPLRVITTNLTWEGHEFWMQFVVKKGRIKPKTLF